MGDLIQTPTKWESNGIEGRGEFPPVLANRYNGRAIVMGTGRSIWNDLSRFKHKGYGVIAVNNMILHYKGRVDHACSMHPEEPELWKELRTAYECEQGEIITHSPCTSPHGKEHKTDYTWAIDDSGGGTSSLFAVMLGLALGYNRIVLCGVPMDDSGHFYDPEGYKDGAFRANYIRNEWSKSKIYYFKDRVRSMSVWTEDLLGRPTETWLL